MGSVELCADEALVEVTSSKDVSKSRCAYIHDHVEEVLESHPFHVIVIILVLIDVVIVLFELLLDFDAIEIEDEHKKETLENALHISSLAILTVFLLEVFVKIYVFKLKYFKNCFEVFDGVVVIISFVLDLLHSKTSTVAELVIVARLWRVARIINGIILSLKTSMDEQLDELRESNARLVQRNTELSDKVEELEDKLRKYLKDGEGSD